MGKIKITQTRSKIGSPKRQKDTLEALGFEVGKLTYVDNIGKDMVLGLKHEGKRLNAGDMLPKTSKIDLVLGNGNRPSSN